MAKIILEFDMYEDNNEARRAMCAGDVCLAVSDLFSEFRNVWKYSEDDVAIKYAEFWRDRLLEIMSNYNLPDID